VLVVGKITGCYGIKGWVKVHPYTESPAGLLDLSDWQVKRKDGYEPLPIDSGKPHGKGLVVHISGVDDRTLAEVYRGLEIAVPDGQLPALEQGDYYWRDLEGLAVWCLNSGERYLLGEVDYLIETGANDVLVVKSTDSSIDDNERLIPYLPGETVRQVDLEAATIEVDWFLELD